MKDLKNTIMASFQAKIGWKRMRKRENKNYHYILYKDLKNTIMASFQAIIGWKRMRKSENKNYRYVSFLPDA